MEDNKELQPDRDSTNTSVSGDLLSNNLLIPIIYVLIILSFFLPFVTLKLGSPGGLIPISTNISVSGFNLITGGGQLASGGMFPIIIAFAAAIIGLGVILIKDIRAYLISTISGIVGVLALLFLQYALNSEVKAELSKQSMGLFDKSAIQLNFNLGFWVILIGFIIVGILSFLRINMRNNFSTPSSSISASMEEEGQDNTKTIISNTQYSSRAVSINIGDWIKKNTTMLVVFLLFGVAGSVLYFIFIKNYPEKDALKVHQEKCKCEESRYNDHISAQESFINDFSIHLYFSKNAAREKINSLMIDVNERYDQCLTNFNTMYTKYKNKYLSDEVNLRKFNSIYESQACIIKNTYDHSSTSKIEELIATIKNPEPGVEDIKNDLLGLSVPGWEFKYLSQFRDIEILNETKGINRIEYQVKLALFDNQSNLEYESEIMIAYNETEIGWYIANINLSYLSCEYLIPHDKWFTVPTISRTKWSAANNHKLTWLISGFWNSKEYYSGPDVGSVNLPSSNNYQLKSREGEPVKVKFTYRPL